MDLKFTNKSRLPEPLYRALTEDNYSRGAADISVTALIGPPKIEILKEEYKHLLTADAEDRLWSVFGTAVHEIIARGSEGLSNYTAEERLFTNVGGFTISGGIDLQALEGSEVGIIDWKTCSMYSIQNPKDDWVRQLNCYAALVRKEKGLDVKWLQIVALAKDWSRSKARFDKTYPQSPISMIDIPLWTPEEQDNYLESRVAHHMGSRAQYEMDASLPDCTPEEMWESGGGHAVVKPGNPRALKIHKTWEEARAHADNVGGWVEARHPTRMRCESYCEVSGWCKQYKEWKKLTGK